MSSVRRLDPSFVDAEPDGAADEWQAHFEPQRIAPLFVDHASRAEVFDSLMREGLDAYRFVSFASFDIDVCVCAMRAAR